MKNSPNTSIRFACPDGHTGTLNAGGLQSDLYDFEKWLCLQCGRFFYLHIINGGRIFCTGEGDPDIDAELSPMEGFEQGNDGVIRKSD